MCLVICTVIYTENVTKVVYYSEIMKREEV